MTFKRRDFLKSGIGSSLMLAMRATATGVPLSFLLNPLASANLDGTAKYSIISCSGAGESQNTNGPGSFGPGLASGIDHVIANNETRTINGTQYTSEDLATSTPFWADQDVLAARCYGALDHSFKQNLAWFNHRTLSGVHTELRKVMTGQGGIRSLSGNGLELLPSAIAQETHPLLGTTLSSPVNFGFSGLTDNGTAVTRYKPTSLRDALLKYEPELANFDLIFESAIDSLYKDIKTLDTPHKQRATAFLDNHALTTQQAKILGDALGEKITSISNNFGLSQLTMAIALFELNVTPVVVVNHSFSGDNHRDTDLVSETKRTLSMIDTLRNYSQALASSNVNDKVCYATVDIFGRTAKGANGRGHDGGFASGIIHGAGIRGQLIGGIMLHEAKNGKKRIKASGINSLDGSSNNPDIPGDATLGAYQATIMKAAGVPTERCKARIPNGTIVDAIFG